MRVKEGSVRANNEELPVNHPLFFQMPFDHFGNNSGTFQNRYWINDTYYEKGGPVFIFDSGEQDAQPLVPYYLQEYHGLSATMQAAKRYKGIAILWEHRYYGDSLPFPVNSNTTAAQWQFLTTEQALEDVVYFADHFKAPAGSKVAGTSLHPSTTPWVWLGGSYPGVRGYVHLSAPEALANIGPLIRRALLRVRNPETIYAVWASSAPVHAQVDMASYYKAAERSLTRNCSADWVAVTRYVDEVLKGSNGTLKDDVKFALMKAELSGPGGNTTGADGLTLEEAHNASDYWGFQDSLLPFCNILETNNFTMTPLETGLASLNGTEFAFQAFLTGLAETNYDAIQGDPDDPVQDRSWMRQYCSEYGFYQRGDPNNPLSIETSFLSLELFQAQCNETFADIPPSPEVGHINKYGGWDMNPSNVFWTNGEFDPWRTMGLASIEDNSPHRNSSVIVPPCNTPPPGTDFFGITHDRMVHVSDLRVLLVPDANHTFPKTVGFYSPVSQEPFYSGLGLFELALDEWLPCFGKTEGA
ncbi:peptidase S28 [Punctularia strigosozonata HHB-11173 SS5]|uniref:peptidase S28 n=1 Tax=Punctularia strigosozonata (strain HHB-11173) TaxID=741275 RepID=UPI0004417D60|nr:peptidase S28 [Punctularia strigosozonata HHB-11173 SS5]EIN06329.1 peptidase S28 [Punctularia strigosozonata HHB-11173 SS5]